MLIIYSRVNLYFFLYLFFFKFFFKINFYPITLHSQIKKNIKKKNLFFKKIGQSKNLISKRLTFVLKKRKSIVKKHQKGDFGNFFFKKFFFKTLLSSRKSLKKFFFLTTAVRQKKLNKLISRFHKNMCGMQYEFSLLNILLRGQLFFFIGDALKALKNGFVFVNGIPYTTNDICISTGDCIQIFLSKSMYTYLGFCKKLLKLRVATYKYNAWKFFKMKFSKKFLSVSNKNKKKKIPSSINLLFLFKLDLPRIFELDYMTLSLFFLIKPVNFLQNSYYLYKRFTFKLFSLYNFKKIN